MTQKKRAGKATTRKAVTKTPVAKKAAAGKKMTSVKESAAKDSVKKTTARIAAIRRLSWPDVTRLAMKLPGMEISQSYGTPSLKVKGKFLSRLKEDGETLVLRVSFVVRDHLMQTSPGTYYITDHYRDYPAVLIRISTVDPAVLEQLIEDAWREAAPKKLLQQYDSGHMAPKPRSTRQC